ncbi:MAG TPA: hypothetical protein VJ839_03080 [Candidatus Limnocylindria bacterium]|nr:hypothetical protein [Candidatus Limnocylindria bacterium]
MSRRRRTQAVPQTAGSRPRSRPRLPVDRSGGRRPGRGTTLVLGVGLILIVVGLASVVSDLPASPSPTPATGPLPITFGLALDPDTYLVTQPASAFTRDDPFAYSVNPPVHPGVTDVYVAVTTYEAGQEVVLQPPSPQRLLPEPTSFGYETTTANMIAGFGYGWFTMKIYLQPEGAVYAQGRFEIIDPAAPEAVP